MRKALHKLQELAIRAAFVLIIAAPFAALLIAAAYAERGYSAVGGEWMVIIALVGLLWNITDPRKQREESEKEE